MFITLAVPLQQVAAAASYQCAGTMLQDDDIKSTEDCEAQMQLSTVISSSICLLRAILAESMFQVYCGVLEDVDLIVGIAFTLYIMFYSISLIFGINKTTPRDFLIRYFKIILIYVFVTEAEVFFEFLYKFFIYGLLGGTANFLMKLDVGDKIEKNEDSDSLSEKEDDIFSHVDELFYKVIGDEGLVSFATLAFAYMTTGVGVIVSSLLMFGIFAMIQAFFRMLVTYAVAILALTFLLMFAPFFIIFGMFKGTQFLFKGWLGSLISYTIQPLVVLAFIFLVANVSDVAKKVSEKQYINAELEQPALSAPENRKVENITKIIDMVGQKFKVEAPQFKNEDEFSNDFKEGVFFAMAFLILHAVMNAFLAKVPDFARILGNFQGYSTAANIGQSGPSWKGDATPQSAGIHQPDDFVPKSALKGVLDTAESALPKAAGSIASAFTPRAGGSKK